MKFEKVNCETYGIEFRLDYLIWEREDNNKVIITKMRGTSDYVVENLKTGNIHFLYSLADAKEIGYTL